MVYKLSPGARIGILLCPTLLAGCVIAPGLNLDAGRGWFESEDQAKEEETYTLVPVTTDVVTRLQTERTQAVARDAKREIPADWIIDPASLVYRLGPGDQLEVAVWDHPELSMTQAPTAASPSATDAAQTQVGSGLAALTVSANGAIFFPFAGTTKVAGRTVEEVREILTQALARYIAVPQVDVRVTSFRSKKVLVTGEVMKPTGVPISDVPLRLLDAIQAAGDVRPTAAMDRVKVIRKDKTLTISLLHIYDFGRFDENIVLLPGDIVEIENADSEHVYVMGETTRQGLRPFERGGLTLAAALMGSAQSPILGASSGGGNSGGGGGLIMATADASQIIVLRQGQTKPIVYLLDGNRPDKLELASRFPLRHKDVVYVATANIHRFGKVVQAFQPFIQWGTVGAAIAK
ncbi:polysaccharide biosynthesis/export family protein [Methylotetracoccus oryzae]|uniref:polysaccharide biosynthesis/export family protein n=1 Tax=Methylotetracoccus oryzae TaxID=1919059 RepID=UPI001117B0CB|nr:polysaccharide biosynthesis/export family protein [Methylotetracoccus oryzae]